MVRGRVLRVSEFVESGVGRGAYERWRSEALTPKLFDVGIDPLTFRNDFRRWWIGGLPLVAFEQTGAAYTRSAERARRDGVDAIWVQTTRTGAVDATSGDRTVQVRAGMSAVCDLGRPVDQRTSPGTGLIVVLPRDAFAGAPLDALHGATTGGARHAILSDHLAWLSTAPEPNEGVDPRRVATATAAVVRACFTRGAVPEEAVDYLAGATLRRAVAYIDGRIVGAPVGVMDVAAALGVSRASLYRACASVGGVSALIWERRLLAVRAALSDPAQSGGLSRIAARCGFHTASHFSIRFKDRFGFSPRNLRPF